MKIKLITVGKLKEDYLKKGVEFYSKEIQKKSALEIIEVEDEKAPENRSLKEEDKIKDIEGKKILSKVEDTDYLITLEINGKKIDTREFKVLLLNAFAEHSGIAFVIGGSLGLSKEVSRRSNYKMSFSDMTFPHQLMRLILLEQINRAI